MSNVHASVIVAIFNAENTLPRLLDSLRRQTMNNFEVLMIDDGSTDNSGSICDGYAKSDDRFKAFHKPNEGIGTTRQFGIEHAKGEFTIHADADDWVEDDYLEKLYQKAVSANADMVICDFWEERRKKTVYNKQKPSSLNMEGLLKDLIIYDLWGSPCNKLLKRSFYMEHGIRYINGLDYGEDKLFNLQLIKCGAIAAYLPQALYHVDQRTNPNSAVRGCSPKNILEREKYIVKLRESFPDETFRTGIDNTHLGIVFLAVYSNVYDQTEFYNKYGFLKQVRWRDYHGRAFSNNLIIWTSLHCSYKLARFLSLIKKTARRFNL